MSAIENSRFRAALTSPACIFFLISLTIYLCLAILLLHGPDFNDETGKLVGGWMIHDGRHLYKDLFDHHGPFAYMLAHLFYAVTESRNVAHYRLIPLGFSLLSIASVLFTPAVRNLRARLIGASCMALGLAATQAIYGLMLGMYQIYAGHMFVCALALLILPVILEKPAPRRAAFLGGLSLGFIFFSGYSFVAACACLGLICLYKAWLTKNWGPVGNAALGLIVATSVVVLWLLKFGDLRGYIVYHFYFNQVIYAKFIESYCHYNPWKVLYLLFPMAGFWGLDAPVRHVFSYIIFSATPVFAFLLIFPLFKKTESDRWRKILLFLLLVAGITFTNPRATDDFQADTLVIVTIGFVALAFAALLEKNLPGRRPVMRTAYGMMVLLVLSLIAAQFVMKTDLYGASPLKYYRMKRELKKSEASDMQFLRSIVADDEPVQQFPYDVMFYIAIDRKPASGNYFYLPWQDAYFKHPLWGYKIDMCQDMATTLPKVIYYAASSVWDYPTSSYMGCVEDLLHKKYLLSTRVDNAWIRADIAASRDDILQSSIIPEDFDVSGLPEKARRRIERARKSF